VEPREGTEGNSNWSAGALVPPVPPARSPSDEKFSSWFPLFHLFPVREDGSELRVEKTHFHRRTAMDCIRAKGSPVRLVCKFLKA